MREFRKAIKTAINSEIASEKRRSAEIKHELAKGREAIEATKKELSKKKAMNAELEKKIEELQHCKYNKK